MERWQESDAGQEYQESLEKLANPEIEELDIDLAEPLDPWLPSSEPGEL